MAWKRKKTKGVLFTWQAAVATPVPNPLAVYLSSRMVCDGNESFCGILKSCSTQNAVRRSGFVNLPDPVSISNRLRVAKIRIEYKVSVDPFPVPFVAASSIVNFSSTVNNVSPK